MAFPLKWRMWVSAIIKASRASGLVKGSPTQEFQSFWGLRKGDPLALFLFIIAMEGLTTMLYSMVQKGIYSGLKCGSSGPALSHFSYVDDVVFLGADLGRMATVLRCKVGVVPFIHLGLQIGGNKNLIDSGDLVELFSKRLSIGSLGKRCRLQLNMVDLVWVF
ncbi:uncharacterized protein LOC143616251 [Bidens hawaiensis]|uniref:uncharacterized protein LOC143616251 n=1 Tax=Bidens hawaiensis TaxID=980011 RepID=UPI00404A4703